MNKLLLSICFPIIVFILAAQLCIAQEHYYVGESACRECHHNQGNRNQFNTWRLTKHAQAYTALSKPEAVEIARLLGIHTDPYESPICLGCHTTASYTEEWERDPQFLFEDGVQCELCHGPGSEYMDMATMQDPKAAEEAGLNRPNEQFCLVCHLDKPSHSKVIPVKPFQYEMALREIAHFGTGGDINQEITLQKNTPAQTNQFSGSSACISCHQKEESGYIYSQWRLTQHANAYAVLGSEKAKQMATELGITEHPQKSPQCLRCHTTGYDSATKQFAAPVDLANGVQCESCHGPAKNHTAFYTDQKNSNFTYMALQPITKDVCTTCHEEGIHGKTFDYATMLENVNHKPPAESIVQVPIYKTPVKITISDDGAFLYITCEASNSVIIVDANSQQAVEEIPVQHLPNDACLSPDQTLLYVSNRGSDTVSVIDIASKQIIQTVNVGDEPHGLVTNQDGSLLFVANAGTGDITVVNTKTFKEEKRLAASRGAWGISRSPDGSEIFVTNNLSYLSEFRETMTSEVTVLNAKSARVTNRIQVPDTNLLQGIAHSPNGDFALITLIRTKNLIPMTRLTQGWIMTNGIGVLWNNGEVDQLLLDEFDAFFSDPTDVCITPNGHFAFVTSGGNNTVAAIDLNNMKDLISNSSPGERLNTLPNHLGMAAKFVVKQIPVGINPRGIAASPDNRFVYVANALEDTISVIDIESLKEVNRIDLGGPETITLERKGERVFHSADIAFGNQFSCHSCHPDGGVDNIAYDIEADGLGVNPVDNRTLRGILDTAPFKWTGKNPSLSRQCGPRLAVFFTRIDPFTPEQVEALERYICSIPTSPNRYRLVGEYTPAQREGKSIFYRTRKNNGELIPVKDRCQTCHPPPYYTNRQRAYTGALSYLDKDEMMDVPHLNNIYETAPYLHDGRAHTLEEIWTRYNPYDEHGITNDLTKDQLNNLIEYIKTF